MPPNATSNDSCFVCSILHFKTFWKHGENRKKKTTTNNTRLGYMTYIYIYVSHITSAKAEATSNDSFFVFSILHFKTFSKHGENRNNTNNTQLIQLRSRQLILLVHRQENSLFVYTFQGPLKKLTTVNNHTTTTQLIQMTSRQLILLLHNRKAISSCTHFKVH